MITLEELKTYLKIEWNWSNDQLEQAIQNALWFLENYLWYSLELNEERIASFCKRDKEFDLPFVYIDWVSKIESWEDEFSSLVEYNWNKKVYEERGFVKTQEVVGPYVEITYSFWYDSTTCPIWLKAILFDIASMSFKNMWMNALKDIQSETVDGDQIVFKSLSGTLSEDSIALLNKYKMYGFSA